MTNRIGGRNAGVAIVGAIVLVTVLTYWRVTACDFVNFDDNIYITGNSHLHQGLCWNSLQWAFGFSNGISYWHPVTWMSLLLDYEWYGLNPAGYHLENLILHTGNAVLLYLILRRITAKVWQSGFVAALFALHPLNVEAVAWVVERKTVLSTFFFMLTVSAYVYYTHRPCLRRYLLITLSFTLGLMTKSMLVTLPCVFLLLDYWPLRRLRLPAPAGSAVEVAGSEQGSPLGGGRLLLEKLPFFGLSVASVALSKLSLRDTEGLEQLIGTPLSEKLANAVVSYAAYLMKMVWPVDLAVLYPIRHHYPHWQVTGATLLLLGISIGAAYGWRRRPWFLCGWLWYLGVMFPVIGLVRGGLWPEMADRFAYIPFIGIYLIITWGAAEITAGWRYRSAALLLSALVVLGGLAALTRGQTAHWKNSISLFEQALRTSGEFAGFYEVLGKAYFDRGEHARGLSLLGRQKELQPESLCYDVAVGRVALEKGNREGAIATFRQALLKNPDDLSALFWLSEAYLSSGDDERALASCLALLRSPEPDEGNFREKALEKKLRLQEKLFPAAVRSGEIFAKKSAAPVTRFELGSKLHRFGFHEEAMEIYLDLQQTGFDSWILSGEIGRLYGVMKRYDDAVRYYEKALAQNSTDLDLLAELGNIQLKRHAWRQAVPVYDRIMALDPGSSDAPQQLAKLHLRLGNRGEAADCLRHMEITFPEFRPKIEPLLNRLK